MNFDYRGGWHISFLAEDCQTTLGKSRTVKDLQALIGIARKLGASALGLARLETEALTWGRGSVTTLKTNATNSLLSS